MKTFKGTDQNMKCRDFQYELGREYEESEAELGYKVEIVEGEK